MFEECIEIPDAEIRHAPEFLSTTEAADVMVQLRMDVAWEQHSVKIAGKLIPCPRLLAPRRSPDRRCSSVGADKRLLLPDVRRGDQS